MSETKTKTVTKIIDLDKYINSPSELIIQSVEDLIIYHQMQSKGSVDLYFKFKDSNSFQGTVQEYTTLESLRNILDNNKGKHWETLLKSIYLLKDFSSKIDFKDFHLLNEKQQLLSTKIISKGLYAKNIIDIWLKPINLEGVFEALIDCVKLKIGDVKYTDFQILDMGKIESKTSSDKKLKIYDTILELDDPSLLADYFKHQKQVMYDGLVLAFTRNKSRYFKTDVHIFLMFKGNLYLIEFNEQRLNLDNTSGDRNGERHIGRMFEKVWLPLEIFFEEKPSTSNAVVVRNQKVFRRGSLTKVMSEQPPIAAWLNLFLYRVFDYLKMKENNIPKAVTTLSMFQALPDKSFKQKIEKTNKIMESENDAGTYLIDIYGEKTTDLVVTKNDLPNIVGTEEFIRNLIEYKHRDLVANKIKDLVHKDYNENYSRVLKWWKDFVKKQDIDDLIKKSLLNNKYTRMKYCKEYNKDDEDNDWLGFGIKKPVLVKREILNIKDRNSFFSYRYSKNTEGIAVLNEFDKLYHHDNYTMTTNCPICLKHPFKQIINLQFLDYRQICEFFNIKPEDLPKEIVDHLHEQNDAYTGNSILNDVDPVGEILDPWFRSRYERDFLKDDDKIRYNFNGKPELSIVIPLCGKCFKKKVRENNNESNT